MFHKKFPAALRKEGVTSFLALKRELAEKKASNFFPSSNMPLNGTH
jgi:hypothetical protein